MRHLLLLLAIFGVLAAAEIAPDNREINEMGENNAAVELDELIPDETIKKCIENGDDEAYLKAKLARQELSRCGSSLLHTDKLLQEVRAGALSNGQGMGPIIKKFCKIFQTSGQLCMDQYLSNLTPCLNDTNKQMEEFIARMVATSWEYSCQNNAHRALLLFNNNTLACLEMKSTGLIECIAPFLNRLRTAGDPTRAVAEVLIKKECSIYSSVTQCIVSTLQECPDQTAADIIGGSFNETQRISPCAGYVPLKPVHRPSEEVATIMQLETAVNRLEETIKRQQAQQEAARSDIVTILEQQTALLKQLSTSLENIIPLVKYGRGRKHSHVIIR